MTKTTRIVCLCILGAGIFFPTQHRIAISKVDWVY